MYYLYGNGTHVSEFYRIHNGLPNFFGAYSRITAFIWLAPVASLDQSECLFLSDRQLWTNRISYFKTKDFFQPIRMFMSYFQIRLQVHDEGLRGWQQPDQSRISRQQPDRQPDVHVNDGQEPGRHSALQQQLK